MRTLHRSYCHMAGVSRGRLRLSSLLPSAGRAGTGGQSPASRRGPAWGGPGLRIKDMIFFLKEVSSRPTEREEAEKQNASRRFPFNLRQGKYLLVHCELGSESILSLAAWVHTGIWS